MSIHELDFKARRDLCAILVLSQNPEVHGLLVGYLGKKWSTKLMDQITSLRTALADPLAPRFEVPLDTQRFRLRHIIGLKISSIEVTKALEALADAPQCTARTQATRTLQDRQASLADAMTTGLHELDRYLTNITRDMAQMRVSAEGSESAMDLDDGIALDTQLARHVSAAMKLSRQALRVGQLMRSAKGPLRPSLQETRSAGRFPRRCG